MSAWPRPRFCPRLVVFLICLLCGAHAAPAFAQSKEFFLKSMYGVWDGDRSHRFWPEQVVLTITPEGAWLDAYSPVNGGRVALTAEKVERDGGVVFTFRPQTFQRPAQNFYTEPPKPILTTGRLLVRLQRPDTQRAPYLAMQVGDVTSATVLTQPQLPPPQDERFYIQGRRSQAYQDWRGRAGAAGGDAIAKLKTMLVKLDGRAPWECYNQRQLMVKPGELTKYEMTAPGPAGFLIYAPSNPPGLTYFISTEPPIYGIIAGQQADYPVIKTNPATYFHTGVTLSFYLRPTGAAPVSSTPVPVTIFEYALDGADFNPKCTADDDSLRPSTMTSSESTPAPASVAAPIAAPAAPVEAPAGRGRRGQPSAASVAPAAGALAITPAPQPPPPPAAAQPAAPPPPAPQQESPSSPQSSPYNGPRSGVLTCKGAPIVQNGEAVFTGLPPVPLQVTVDENIWEARLAPGDGNTQRLILRNKRPGRQSTCSVKWQVE